MSDPVTNAATVLANAGIDAGVKAVESVVPHPAAPLVDAILEQGAASLKAEVPLLVQDIEGALGRFAEYIKEHVLHLIPKIPAAVMALSDDDLRIMLEALSATDFDAHSTVRTYANWTALAVSQNAQNFRAEAARRGLK